MSLDHIDVYHVTATGNVGDHACAPTMYFDFGVPVRYHDVREDKVEPSPLAIVGGGGLFDGRSLENSLQRILARHGHVVLWGAGLNRKRGHTQTIYPDWVNQFALIGVRDYAKDVTLRWVPCPSCMHVSFEIPREAERDFVVYDHCEVPFVMDYENALKYRSTKTAIEAPHESNKKVGTITDAVSFLARGRTVLTTSYHGAYWGMLLERDVIVQGWHSTRFDRMRPEPVVLGPDGAWVHYVASDTQRFTMFNPLQVCRQANIMFADSVRMIVKYMS